MSNEKKPGFSLFQAIREGTITRIAVESQLAKREADRISATRLYTTGQLGEDLYRKRVAELNFAIEFLKMVVDKFEDFKLPLKVKATEQPTSRDMDWENEGGGYGEC